MAVTNRKERRRLNRKAKKKAVQRNQPSARASTTVGMLHQAVALHKSGQLEAALGLYRDVLALDPKNVDALNLGGLATFRLGDPDEAVRMLHAAVALSPDYAEAHSHLGNVLQAMERHEEAIAAYRRAVELKPDYADAHYNLGIVLRTTGDWEASTSAYRRASECAPSFADAHNGLGAMLQNQGQLDAAIACYRRAIQVNPNLPSALSNLGAALACHGQFRETIAYCHRALAINSAHTKTLNNLGIALQNLGQPDEAIDAYRQALALKPGYTAAHSNLIFCMNYEPRFSGEDILLESKRWNEIHAAPRTALAGPFANDPDPERRLRVGYVSADLRQHSVSFFLEPLLAARDPDALETYCYAGVVQPDHWTARFQELSDGWCWTATMSDSALAERIRDDGIDILVDLAGHTASNRLLAFAESPAPVQVTWLGYPNTTGLSAMDYRLTDAVADPEGSADALHSETLVRLPEGFLCYGAPGDAPDVVPPPATVNGHVTFGSFNNLAKVTPEVAGLWAAILNRVRNSRLLIKSRLLADDQIRVRYQDLFASHGIDAERFDLLSAIPSMRGHLAAYERLDIGLDPFPYNGTTTTCEALWMGVPVVALAGERHAGRVGLSLLSTAGLPELAAETGEEYVEIAVQLAADLDRLSALRRDLRRRTSASPLCDAPAFARKVEAAYREMWRRWCAGGLSHE